MSKNPTTENPTACVLIIGNEILSGRTQDVNLNFLAKKLASRGILVKEARVIPDIPEEIISTLNACRAKYSYVFTTGGIGPTHDDITSECVAQAFGVPWVIHEEAKNRLLTYYRNHHPDGESALNAARLRMATMPQGATLIDNPDSIAPGFRIENVFVLAGIPKVMRLMVEGFIDSLAGGQPVIMKGISTLMREGDFADALKTVQKNFPDVDVGSYPVQKGDNAHYENHLICKSTNPEKVEQALDQIRIFLKLANQSCEELGEIK